MPATPGINHVQPIGQQTGIPAYLATPLAANAQVGEGQFVTLDPETGNSALNDGAMPGQVSVGVGDRDKLSATSPNAGSAFCRLTQRWIGCVAQSDEAGDSFDGYADMAKAFYIADENTIGKLSNQGGSNRSLGGVYLGLGTDGYPKAWAGPVAWLLARGALIADAFPGAEDFLEDAAAGDDTAERVMSRAAVHGIVTGIEFIGAAVAESASDNAVITVSKRDGAGGGAVELGTYSTDLAPTGQGAITAFVPAAFALSAAAGALELLETDIITISVVKAGNGQALSGRVRVIQRVC